MDLSLDYKLERALLEIKMMLEAKARRERIVDARSGRQFAAKHLAIEIERGRRDRAAAKAGGGIDPLRLVGAGDERGRLALDVGEEARYGRAMRPGEPPERGRRRAHLAVLDPAQRGAAE